MKYLFRRLLPIILFIGTLLCNVMAGASLGASFVDVVTETNGIHTEASELMPDELVAFRKLQIRRKQLDVRTDYDKLNTKEPLVASVKRNPCYLSSDGKQAVCFGLLFLQQLF
ncbi:MAG: hypothetical protein QM781_00160 [Chitinophagaceae bacterium]